jgi:hypothetical protein
MPSWGGYPVPTAPKEPDSKCSECKRLVKILEQMRALPLPERVSYVYVGLINEALEGK